jgi:MFS family permease
MVLLMAILGITLGAIFIQSTALAAEVVAEEARAMYLAFFDAVIDLSFIVMPLIVGFVARFGESLPFLVCTLTGEPPAGLQTCGGLPSITVLARNLTRKR